MGGVAVGADKGVGKRHAIPGVHHWRHSFQVNLVHDAVARRNHIDVFKCGLGPVYKMKTVIVATIFNGPVFLESVRFKARMFYRQRVIDNQLGWYYWVHLGGIATLSGDGIAQAREIY